MSPSGYHRMGFVTMLRAYPLEKFSILFLNSSGKAVADGGPCSKMSIFGALYGGASCKSRFECLALFKIFKGADF